MTAAGKDQPAVVLGPADMDIESGISLTPEPPGTAEECPVAAAEAAPQAESAAAMDEDTLSGKPQEAAHADTDTAMQEADGAAEESAQVAADTEMADLHAPLNSEEEAPAPDQAVQHTSGGDPATEESQIPDEAFITASLHSLQQQADTPETDLRRSSAERLLCKAGPAIVSGGHSGMMQTAQARSASAGSVPNGSVAAPSAILTEQKATQMHSPAAGILSRASVSACIAATAAQPEIGSMHSAAEAEPSKAADAQTQPSQTPGAAAELPKEAPTSAVLATDDPVTPPDLSNQQQRVQVPGTEAAARAQQTKQAVDMPKPPVTAAAAHKTAAPAAPATGQSGLQPGSSAITPPLRVGIFGSPIAASSVKASQSSCRAVRLST